MQPCVFPVLLRDSEQIPGEGNSWGVSLISVVLETPNGKYFDLEKKTLRKL